jgi:hypothetical protein
VRQAAHLQLLVHMLAGWVNRHQQLVIEGLQGAIDHEEGSTGAGTVDGISGLIDPALGLRLVKGTSDETD